MNDGSIRESLAALLRTAIASTPPDSIGGGSTHRCLRYRTRNESVFVKVTPLTQQDMLEAEAAGLEELRVAKAIRVPNVLGLTSTETHALLALEWLDLRPSTAVSDASFGEQLATLHRVVKPLFGWKRSNYIGPTPQINLWGREWLHFWRTHRFEPQLELAIANGASGSIVEPLALLNTLLDGFFVAHQPQASLLHGDLWSGNYGATINGEPVIFDPAVYFGDRECDLAMTRLFGGFSQDFYSAYENAWPLDDGWQQRLELYNLYHVLNHFNLFGGGYLAQAEKMAANLLAELGH